MDQNKKNKVKNFFRKEGFYLVLFLCLCLIATVTVVTTRNRNLLKQNENSGNEFTLIVDDKPTSETQKQNAERVENEEDLLVEENEEAEAEAEEDVNVSSDTTTEVIFNNPIIGEVLRGYTYPKPQPMADGTSRNIRGIDIKAAIGTEVTAAAEGEVKEVSNKIGEGTYIVIAHANGLYTKYTNLAKDTRVNVGDRVTAETVIGTVGETSKIFTTSEFGEHLNIQVYDANGKDLNPTSYFTFNQ